MPSRARRYEEPSGVINFRIRELTRALLARAAARSGRTLSGEAEHQLRRALVDLSTPTPGIMAAIARAIDLLAQAQPPVGAGRTKWWNDPRQFDRVAKLVSASLEMLRPGPPPPESAEGSDEWPDAPFQTMLLEIQSVDASIPFAEQTPHQRQLVRLKADLGPLVDRALARPCRAAVLLELQRKLREDQ